MFPGQQLDREGFKRMTSYHGAFSNTRFIVEEQVAEADKVVSRFTVHATHDLGGVSGRRAYRRSPHGHLHPPHLRWQDRRGEELGTIAQTMMEQRLEQERVERERIEQELEVARSIQQASLPEEVPTPEGWQIAPYYQPAREVGGDFYDFLELADGRLGVVVGDATGKGVPADLMMASTRSTLRAVAQTCESPQR